MRLLDGSVIDVSGGARDFNGQVVTASAGTVQLSSLAGAAAIESGARITADGAALGGAAGFVDIAAKTLQLDGTLTAATAADQAGGRLRLDVQTLEDFSKLNGQLNAGNFSESRDLRVRQGNLKVAAEDVVTARNIVLAADSGRIDIDGRLDAGSAQGRRLGRRVCRCRTATRRGPR